LSTPSPEAIDAPPWSIIDGIDGMDGMDAWEWEAWVAVSYEDSDRDWSSSSALIEFLSPLPLPLAI
jgi:hypothetical protein